MNEEKEKDRILAQIKAFKSHNEIEGLPKHIYDLERDGYVSAVRDEQGDLIIVRITPRGKDFLDNGGYSARRRVKSPNTKSINKAVWTVALSVISGLTIAYLSKILGWI